MNITMDSITIESVKKATSCSFIDNDLALIDDISTVTMSNSARYMRCFIIVICSQGHLSYTVDTIQQTVNAGSSKKFLQVYVIFLWFSSLLVRILYSRLERQRCKVYAISTTCCVKKYLKNRADSVVIPFACFCKHLFMMQEVFSGTRCKTQESTIQEARISLRNLYNWYKKTSDANAV